jgi:hypothetical protein
MGFKPKTAHALDRAAAVICKTVDTQMKFCKTVVVRSGFMAVKLGVMTSRDKSSLQAAEMRILKSVIVIM